MSAPAKSANSSRVKLLGNARWCIEHATMLRRLGRPGQAAAALREAAAARVRVGKYKEVP